MKFRKFLQHRVLGSTSMNTHGANAAERGDSGHYTGADRLVRYSTRELTLHVPVGERLTIRLSRHPVKRYREVKKGGPHWPAFFI